MLVPACIFVTVFVIDIWTDLWRRKHDKPIDHVRGAVLRIAGLIPFVVTLPHDNNLGAVMGLFLYMSLFNGIFGLIAHKNWFYLGDSYFDSLIKKMGAVGFIVLYSLTSLFLIIYFF